MDAIEEFDDQETLEHCEDNDKIQDWQEDEHPNTSEEGSSEDSSSEDTAETKSAQMQQLHAKVARLEKKTHIKTEKAEKAKNNIKGVVKETKRNPMSLKARHLT